MTARVLAVGLVLAVFAAAGLLAGRALARPGSESQELAVEKRLACPQCAQVRLDVCDRPICADMRADIHRRLATGESPDAIVRSYQAVYGTAVLSDPLIGAPGLVPWLGIGGGLVLLLLAASRLRSQGSVASTPPPASGRVDEALRAWRLGR